MYTFYAQMVADYSSMGINSEIAGYIARSNQTERNFRMKKL